MAADMTDETIAQYMERIEKMSIKETAGCAIMFIAIILIQLPSRSVKSKLQ